MYDLHYQILDALSDEINTIAPTELYNVDPEKLLVDCLNRLAQPLPNGTASPFSGRNVASGEGIISSVLLVMLQYFAHELNLFPDALLLNHLRIFGLTRKIAEAPLIQLEFRRTDTELVDGEAIVIPAGTKIKSKFYSNRYATVIEDASHDLGEFTITAIARIDNPGQLTVPVKEREFSILPISLTLNNIEDVTNTEIISQGIDQESIADLVARTRTLFSRPGNRVITARDYQEVAKSEGGATSAIALPRLGINNDRTYYMADLVTVAVYPEDAVTLTRLALIDKIPAGTRLEVVPARVVPIEGTINIGIDPSLSEIEAYNLVATAIQDNINPPYATFGDQNFISNLSLAIEKISGIYSFKPESLYHSETGIALSELEILPMDLLEIQQATSFNWL